jgi:hypothetical protein
MSNGRSVALIGEHRLEQIADHLVIVDDDDRAHASLNIV